MNGLDCSTDPDASWWCIIHRQNLAECSNSRNHQVNALRKALVEICDCPVLVSAQNHARGTLERVFAEKRNHATWCDRPADGNTENKRCPKCGA